MEIKSENKKDYTDAQKRACKKYYDKNKLSIHQKYIDNRDVLKSKALARYIAKYNNDDVFKQARKLYMREYQKKKRDIIKAELQQPIINL